MKKTQIALVKRMHFVKPDGEEAQLLVEFDAQRVNLITLSAAGAH